MSDTYRVMTPDDNPASLGYPVEATRHTSLPAALSSAEKHAKAQRSRNATAIVEQVGTPNVWSVTYHPEAPLDSGDVDADGLPVFVWPVEFRITHDGQEAAEVDLGAGPVGSGELRGPRAVFDLTPDGEEVPRDDLA